MKHLTDMLAPFHPTTEQLLIKARLQQVLEERSFAMDADSLTINQIENITGCSSIGKWAKENPSFLGWLLDKDLTKHKVQAYADVAVDILYDILMSDTEPKVLTAKDKIQAANILLQLGDRFPSKRKEVRFLDKELEGLDEGETKRRIAELKTKIAVTDGEKS